MRGLEDLLTCSLKEEMGFNRKQILLEGCVSGGGDDIFKTGLSRFLEVDFVQMNFVKSNKKNNSKISLWYKLTYVGFENGSRETFPSQRLFQVEGMIYSRQRSAPSV